MCSGAFCGMATLEEIYKPPQDVALRRATEAAAEVLPCETDDAGYMVA